jgi:hypothetical protein
MHGFVDRMEDPVVSDQFEQGGKLLALRALDDGSADLMYAGPRACQAKRLEAQS